MALTLRTLVDDADTAVFEIIGGADGDSGIIVNVSDLNGGAGDNTERVKVTKVTALVCITEGSTGGSVKLSWAGEGDFLTLPAGVTDLKITCLPPTTASGDITATASASATFTLRLTVQKYRGFALSMAG